MFQGEWLKGASKAVLAALLTAGGFLGFVAAVGGAIVWTRFDAAELPADQALAALPRGELVATGAVTLGVFCLLGLLATLGVYLLDHRVDGQPADGQPAGGGRGNRRPRRDMSRGLIALVTAEALVVVFLAGAVFNRALFAIELVAAIGAVAFFATLRRSPLTCSSDDGDAPDGDSRQMSDFRTVGVAVAAWAPLLAGWVLWSDSDGEPWETPTVTGLLLLIAGMGLTAGWLLTRGDRDAEALPSPSSGQSPANPAEELRLSRTGGVAMVGLGAWLVAVPPLVLGEGWVTVPLALAVASGVVLWRIALETRAFLPYGLAVFLSVPLLGGVAGVAQNFADPQVQPVALIRASDGLDAALQGLYVTENDERIYFANVATERCNGNLRPDSGRLLWVDREDVVAMSIGPAQSVEQAGETALEMHYALAPAAANPFADGGSASSEPAVTGASAQPRRLEASGPALRRTFGNGLTLGEQHARVGDTLTLTGRGLGGEQGDRVLRVGGVEVTRVDVWKPRQIQFTVPEGAASGAVTIECAGVETQPILRISVTPAPRMSVTPARGTYELSFDGTDSTDDDGIASWAWKLGRKDGSGPRATHTVRPSAGVTRARLTVTDRAADSDGARAWIWRRSGPSPEVAAGLSGDRIRGLQARMLDGARLVVHGHVPEDHERPGGASLELARSVRDRLLDGDGLDEADSGMRGFAAGCPVGGSARAAGRFGVDVFVVEAEVRVGVPEGCVAWAERGVLASASGERDESSADTADTADPESSASAPNGG